MSIENYISFSGTLGLIIAIALNIIVGIVGGLMAEKTVRNGLVSSVASLV
jgi:hypothetical protein